MYVTTTGTTTQQNDAHSNLILHTENAQNVYKYIYTKLQNCDSNFNVDCKTDNAMSESSWYNITKGWVSVCVNMCVCVHVCVHNEILKKSLVTFVY